MKRLRRTLGLAGIREKLLRRICSFLLARRCNDKGHGGITPLAFSTEFSMAPMSQPHELLSPDHSSLQLGPLVGGHGHHLLGILVGTVLQVVQEHPPLSM